MARYLDSWVLHKTLYDVMSEGGGSCVCVNPNNSNSQSNSNTTFLPISLKSFDSLVQSIKDIEIQDIQGEQKFYLYEVQKSATASSHHTSDSILLLSEDLWCGVWIDRIQVRLRFDRSPSTSLYALFFSSFQLQQVNNNIKEENDFYKTKNNIHLSLLQWFQQHWTLHELESYFTCTRLTLIQVLRDTYKLVENNYLDLFIPCILEQMEHFTLTKYQLDCRGQEEEIEFERNLKTNTTHFYLSVVKTTTNNNNNNFIATVENQEQYSSMNTKMVDTTTLEVFISFMTRFIKSPILEKSQENQDLLPIKLQVQQQGNNSNIYPSFRYDRRMIRLIIAKYWIDGIILRWLKDNNVNIVKA